MKNYKIYIYIYNAIKYCLYTCKHTNLSDPSVVLTGLCYILFIYVFIFLFTWQSWNTVTNWENTSTYLKHILISISLVGPVNNKSHVICGRQQYFFNLTTSNCGNWLTWQVDGDESCNSRLLHPSLEELGCNTKESKRKQTLSQTTQRTNDQLYKFIKNETKRGNTSSPKKEKRINKKRPEKQVNTEMKHGSSMYSESIVNLH